MTRMRIRVTRKYLMSNRSRKRRRNSLTVRDAVAHVQRFECLEGPGSVLEVGRTETDNGGLGDGIRSALSEKTTKVGELINRGI